MLRWIAIVFASASLLSPSYGMLYYNLGNGANTTDPGTGVPFDSVGKVTTSDGSGISGSAIYLGDGYVLTANHVTTNATYGYVTFGSTVYQMDTVAFSGSMTIQVEPGVDMKIMKLTTTPTVSAVNLLSTPTEQVASATLVSWGNGRDASVPLGSTTVNWGNSTTSAHRWGTNVIKFAQSISYDGYTEDILGTILGGPAPTYIPSGVGDGEASVVLNDSGSGLFQQIGGTWYLVGLTVVTETAGSSTFGNDQTTLPRGDADFFVRISSYEDSIMAIIPEPSAAALLGLTAVSFGLVSRRARQSGS